MDYQALQGLFLTWGNIWVLPRVPKGRNFCSTLGRGGGSFCDALTHSSLEQVSSSVLLCGWTKCCPVGTTKHSKVSLSDSNSCYECQANSQASPTDAASLSSVSVKWEWRNGSCLMFMTSFLWWMVGLGATGMGAINGYFLSPCHNADH